MISYQIIDDANTTPVVCIAMLTYNHDSYVEQALESILSQQLKYSYKIIIADDDSTDNTRRIIRSYQKKYPHLFKLILQEFNVGLKQNNIDLLSNLEGEYVAALEGDDYWIDPLKLQKQVDFLNQNQDYSFSLTRFKTYNEESKVSVLDLNGKYFPEKKSHVDFTYEIFLRGWHIGTQTLMFRKSMLDISGFQEFNYFRDIHIITHLLKKAKGVCLNFVGAIYRIHDAGIHSGVSKFNFYMIGFHTHREIYYDNKSNRFLKKKYLLSFKNYINAHIVEGYLCKAFTMSIHLFFLNWSIIIFMKLIKRIITKRFKA